MKPDEFEPQLRRQPLRPIPAEWRDQILAAARAAVPRSSALDARRPSWWRELLWPSPLAWAGAAAVWAVILALDAAAFSDTEPSMAARFAPPPAVIRMAIAERRRLMASLFDAAAEPAAPPPARNRTVSAGLSGPAPARSPP